MMISQARVTETETCKRCAGNGYVFGEIMRDCFRCGGNGRQPKSFDGVKITAHVLKSRTMRGGSNAGRRSGSIDVVAQIETYGLLRKNRGTGIRSTVEVVTEYRIVGRMVDGAAFDKTIRATGTDTASLLRFEEQRFALDRRIADAIGTTAVDVDERAELVGLGVIAADFAEVA